MGKCRATSSPGGDGTPMRGLLLVAALGFCGSVRAAYLGAAATRRPTVHCRRVTAAPLLQGFPDDDEDDDASSSPPAEEVCDTLIYLLPSAEPDSSEITARATVHERRR